MPGLVVGGQQLDVGPQAGQRGPQLVAGVGDQLLSAVPREAFNDSSIRLNDSAKRARSSLAVIVIGVELVGLGDALDRGGELADGSQAGAGDAAPTDGGEHDPGPAEDEQHQPQRAEDVVGRLQRASEDQGVVARGRGSGRRRSGTAHRWRRRPSGPRSPRCSRAIATSSGPRTRWTRSSGTKNEVAVRRIAATLTLPARRALLGQPAEVADVPATGAGDRGRDVDQLVVEGLVEREAQREVARPHPVAATASATATVVR